MAQRDLCIGTLYRDKEDQERTRDKGFSSTSAPFHAKRLLFLSSGCTAGQLLADDFSHSSIYKVPFSWAPRALSYFHQKTELV